MKLWLQVLFAQGYLWRDRFPSLRAPPEQPPRINWVCLGGGAGIVVNGLLHLTSGSLWAGGVLAAWGIVFMLSCASPVLVRLLPGDEALNISLAWVPGLVFVLLAPAAILLLALNATVLGIILIVIPFGLAGIVFSTLFLREIQIRYLFFANPQRNAALFAERAEDERGFASFFIDTYWHLPRRVVSSMLRPAEPYEGGA